MGDSAVRRETPDRTRLSVASYNVHSCRGLDLRRDVDRVAQVIRALRCDVVGLQEVGSLWQAGALSRQIEYFAEATGFRAVAGPTIESKYRQFGNGLLTTCRVAAVRRVPLSVGRLEPRGALDVDLDVGVGMVRIIVTHLGLRRRERAEQAARLISALANHGAQLTIVLADVNEWSRHGPAGRLLSARMGRIDARPTFPSIWPLAALDRILVDPARALLATEALSNGHARAASDHLPVRADIALDGLVAAPR